MHQKILQYCKLLKAEKPFTCVQDLRKAYLREVLVVHPDVAANGTCEKFRALTHAYACLHAYLTQRPPSQRASASVSNKEVNRLHTSGWGSWEEAQASARMLNALYEKQISMVSDWRKMLMLENFSIGIERNKEILNSTRRYHYLHASDTKSICVWNANLCDALFHGISKSIQIIRKVIEHRKEKTLPRSPRPLLLLGRAILRLPGEILAKDKETIAQNMLLHDQQCTDSEAVICSLSENSLSSLENRTIQYMRLCNQLYVSERFLQLFFQKLPIHIAENGTNQPLEHIRQLVSLIERLCGALLGSGNKGTHVSDVQVFEGSDVMRSTKLRSLEKYARKISAMFRCPHLHQIILREPIEGTSYDFTDDLTSMNRLPTTAIEKTSDDSSCDPTTKSPTFRIVRCNVAPASADKLRVYIDISAKPKIFLQRFKMAGAAFCRVVESQKKIQADIRNIQKGLPTTLRRAFVRFFFFTFAEELLFWNRLKATSVNTSGIYQGCDVYRLRSGVIDHISEIPKPPGPIFDHTLWWHEPVIGRSDCPSVVADHAILSSQDNFDEWLRSILFSTYTLGQCERFKRRHSIRVPITRGNFQVAMEEVFFFLESFHASVCRSLLEGSDAKKTLSIRVMPSDCAVFINAIGEVCIPWNATSSELSASLQNCSNHQRSLSK